jgi:hypothetical protein
MTHNMHEINKKQVGKNVEITLEKATEISQLKDTSPFLDQPAIRVIKEWFLKGQKACVK